AIEDGSAPHLDRCVITGNSAPAGGGVFVRAGSAPVFEHTVIANNFLNTTNAAGGGVAVISAELTLDFCDITDNVATGPGGGIAVIEGQLNLYTSRVLGNSTTDAYGPGGGVHCETGSAVLFNSLIAGNSVVGSDSDGGGLYFFFSDNSEVRSCTVVGNTTNGPNGHGGGIACFLASPVIEQSIVAFNLAGRGLYCVDGSSVPQVSCSDIFGNAEGDGICGDDVYGNFSADPLFCNRAVGNYTLQTSSPCAPGHHPTGASCDLIGAFGTGSCNASDVGDPEAVSFRHFASPNPCGSETGIHFTLPAPARVRVTIFDATGRLRRVIADDRYAAGTHRVGWDVRDDEGRPLGSGVYFYTVGVDGRSSAGRLVVAR
ncbi:MAG: T9SS type A sorting domain-containing protein, partial [Candidatus Eisenbacteria bacterium]|nr:T9SS type A sorting domain-containing protein [Candidatus Eisenbacteria bacterium]